MRHVLLDAQIIAGYFKESVLGISNDLTGSVVSIVENVGDRFYCYLDEGGQIEHEWRTLVEREWFDAWFPNFIAAGAVYVKPLSDRRLEAQLRMNNFPRGTRDIWYIRVGCSVRDRLTTIVEIVSEDLDFHEPAAKRSTAAKRQKILANRNGCICRILSKTSLEVHAVCTLPQ